VNLRIIRDTIFCDYLRFDLIRPINLEDSMVMSQNKQKLIIKIVAVNTHFCKTCISSISTNYNDSLSFGDIEFNNSTEIIKDIDISKIDLEVSDRKLILMKEWSVHNSYGPRFEWIVYWHDFNISIFIIVFIYMLGKIGSNQIMIIIFSQQTNFSVINFVKGNI